MFDINKIRADFPILNQKVNGKPLVYLDNAATTQKPRQVLNKIVEFYSNFNSNIHRGVHSLSEQASGLYEASREKVRQFINAANPIEIIFTRSTTESINLVAESFGEAFIGEDDEIIITEMEHHSNLVPWQKLCRRKGAVLRVASFNGNGMIETDRLSRLFSDKTKLMSVTFVSNVLGQINPVAEIIDMAHAHGVPVLIDGAQAIQHIPVDVQELGCDFFAFSGHKMYADTGIGVLYGKEKWLERMPPYQSGGGMISSVDFGNTTYGELPLKFEAGTPHISGTVSLTAAIEYLQETGLHNIAAHESDLLKYAIGQLQTVESIRIYGRSPRPCGAVSFNLNDFHPYDVGMILDKMGVAVRTGNLCAEPVMKHFGINGIMRASFGMYNTRDEVDLLVLGLQKAQRLLGG